ncbi:double-stranded RNA-binding protein 4-like [Vicia villosa]|uniref:double-stranded RNA-binding protein 4-like n=1 Tax=Vicia villosa TaxID=3911 RepID=UPI00273C6197|nr:double-stranded RNA-binding protein 4-like [Vicia villosa]
MASSSSSLPTPTSLSLEHELSPELLPTPNYKNKLIEFTQRANMAMPEYQSHNEGASHAPEFRCSVLADGLVFTVPNKFFHRRAAEQEVSRVALEYLVKKIKDEGRAMISKSVTFCKGLMNEYALKLSVKPPIYNTVEYEKVFPYFVCTMEFNCTSYTGDPARRKKDAEDLAARAAILSIIDSSDSGIMLVQMIKTKSQLFNAVLSKTLLPTCDTLIVSPIEKTALSCELVQGLDDKDKGIAVPAGSDNINSIQTVRTKPGPVISTPQQPVMPNPEPAPEAAKSPNGSPAPEAAKSPNGSQQPDNALPIDNAVSAKKRKRNNHKANKRERMKAQLKALPSGQAASSVAQ